MPKTVSFRIDTKKVAALDALASAQARDRSYLLNEAVDHYLELHAYHRELIEEGVRQADAGELVPHRAVRRMVRGRRAR